MNYEKKYKEVLDKASVWHQQCIERDDTSRAERLENIFPELKESEDERIRKELLNYLYDVHDDDEERAKWITWLEKKEESSDWSEEDEKKRTLLISILEVNHPNEYFKVNPANTLNMEAMYTEELVSWLKSLKDRVQPKSTWKPSGEQMEALCKFIDTGNTNATVLESLYNDLKKELRNEYTNYAAEALD